VFFIAPLGKSRRRSFAITMTVVMMVLFSFRVFGATVFAEPAVT